MASPRNPDAEWLDLVAELMAGPLTSVPHEPVAQLLCTTFDSPACSFHELSAAGQRVQVWPPEHFAGWLDEMTRWSQREAPTHHPILRYYLASGDGRSTQVADVPARFADTRVHGRWREVAARFGGSPSQLALPLIMGADRHRSFVVARADPFTLQEMTLARRVQRLLAGLDRQVTTYARWTVHAGPDGTGVAQAVRLTPRELAVLDLLAAGHTAGAMGRRLQIAERTVQKHLERIYAKIGVSDRLSAVLRARRIGLLAPA